GYPEFDHVFMKKLGWWNDLTDAEKAAAEGKNWKTDLSGGIQRVVMARGCHPWGNAKARAGATGWSEAAPLSCAAPPPARGRRGGEPIYSTRPDLIDKYPTYDDKRAF